MKQNPDGSLTIYVQNASPGPDKQDNWLPHRGTTSLSTSALMAQGKGHKRPLDSAARENRSLTKTAPMDEGKHLWLGVQGANIALCLAGSVLAAKGIGRALDKVVVK